MTRKFVSEEEMNKIFPSLPKKKSKTISNPPLIQKAPYEPRKSTKK